MLTDEHGSARVVELQVEALLDESLAREHVASVAAAVAAGLADADVILHTSRLLVRTGDPAETPA
ncbi:hypothetical protein BH11ACT1_BH11ACT1_01140 [soil metagenome]